MRRLALAVVLLVLFAHATACAGAGGAASGGGSLEGAGRWLAPSSATFERRFEPFTAENPTPETRTAAVAGGGGADFVGGVVNTFAPGIGTLVAGLLGTGGLFLAGRKVSQAQLIPALKLLMQALELAAPEVRDWLKAEARRMGLSSFFESIIASGEVQAPTRTPKPKRKGRKP